MTDAERERVAERWLRKYGEPIDSPGIQAVAHPRALATARLSVFEAEAIEEGIALLQHQKAERSRFLDGERKGTTRTLRDLLMAAGPPLDDPRLQPTEPLRPPVLPGIIDALQLSTDALIDDLRAHSDGMPDWMYAVHTRRADHAFNRACFEISEWIRRRHRGVQGVPDRRVSWPDVRDCLLWYGEDLGRFRNPEHAVRLGG